MGAGAGMAQKPTDPGTRIGTAISNGFKAAFPEVKTVVEGIASLFNLKKNDKKDQEQAAKIEATVKKSLDDAKAKTITAIKPLSEISLELEPVLTAMETAARVQAPLTRILTLADPKAKLSKTDPKWTQIEYSWNECEKSLTNLSKLKSDQLKDKYLRDTVQGAISLDEDGLLTNTKKAMTSRESQDVADFVTKILSKLDRVPALGGYLVSDLLLGVSGLEGQLRGAQGTANARLQEHLSTFKTILESRQ
jgi:hypothetical protein